MLPPYRYIFTVNTIKDNFIVKNNLVILLSWSYPLPSMANLRCFDPYLDPTLKFWFLIRFYGKFWVKVSTSLTFFLKTATCLCLQLATFRLGQFSYCYQTTQQGSEPDQNTKVRIPPPPPETKRGTVNYNKTQVRRGNIAELSVPERYDGGALGALERSVVLNVILNLLLVGCVVRSRCEGCKLWTWG